jgi:hypothetical protein
MMSDRIAHARITLTFTVWPNGQIRGNLYYAEMRLSGMVSSRSTSKNFDTWQEAWQWAGSMDVNNVFIRPAYEPESDYAMRGLRMARTDHDRRVKVGEGWKP